MSLRPTEKNLRHTELSLTDRHTVQEPLPYRTNFLKHWFMCLNKKILEFFSTQWQNSFSEAYNYLTIVMNSAFNAT